ncbi:MAG: phosphoribosylamine--glycine ligase [Saprospiraceae bacterium]|nr:phosphoribosylamine--glycine ligase [Saprospiraceae bacterium]
MSYNILLLGSGGREHALAAKMAESPLCHTLYIAPGNGGTGLYGTNLDVSLSDFGTLEKYMVDLDITMLVVGPEAPLVDGIVDFCKKSTLDHIRVIGPDQYAAGLEGSKAFAKKFMDTYQIPTAGYLEVTQNNIDDGLSFLQNNPPPYVLKADGLAAGKGVLIIDDLEEASLELKNMLNGKFGKASDTVVIEQFLDGIEFSVFALTDGQNYVILPQAKDYKRVGEGDTGLNTGGMGAVSPVSFLDESLKQKVEEKIIKPTIAGLSAEKMWYKGFVFFGLIKVGDEPFVIEYNCRLGDPETEVVLPRLDEDLVSLFEKVSEGSLDNRYCREKDEVAAAIMLVSGGYPGDFEKGKTITFPTFIPEDVRLFHAGTSKTGDVVKTSGGRVMAVTGMAPTKTAAVSSALETADLIHFDGKYFRRDIGFDL